jgi:adenosylcobinamide kinase/adenosylcobinamide-phosphate guanylyltransferase
LSVLVLGGARSGKSSFAERLAAEAGQPVLYVATATASDDEMAERIRQHQARRPPEWRTLEAPTHVAEALRVALGDARTVILEDLTLLLSNLMLQLSAVDAEAEAKRDLTAILQPRAGVEVIVVSNEVGMGLVPPYPLGRQFRDALGRLNQCAAARVNDVYLMVAGLPLRLK